MFYFHKYFRFTPKNGSTLIPNCIISNYLVLSRGCVFLCILHVLKLSLPMKAKKQGSDTLEANNLARLCLFYFIEKDSKCVYIE